MDDLAHVIVAAMLTSALVGEIQVNATPGEIRLEALEDTMDAALLRAAGNGQNLLVAGVGFNCSLLLHAAGLPLC